MNSNIRKLDISLDNTLSFGCLQRSLAGYSLLVVCFFFLNSGFFLFLGSASTFFSLSYFTFPNFELFILYWGISQLTMFEVVSGEE